MKTSSKQLDLDLGLVAIPPEKDMSMSKKPTASAPPLFKPYDQNQQMLLPPDLSDLIPENHLVRVVSQAIDRMDIKALVKSYKGGGTTSYAPRMMLKLWVYGYISQVYTCRRLHKALLENIHFMWLAGQNRPDFRTLQNFRLRLKSSIEDIFAALVSHLTESGYIKMEHYFVDGTRIRANASKYSYVWKKNTVRHSARLKERIGELLEHIDRINEAEEAEYGESGLEETGEGTSLDSEQLERIVQELNRKLEKNPPENRTLERAKRKMEKEYLPRLRKYEEQQKDLGKRNSCSKIDKDATFFRFKNDELLPAYNILAGTENRFFINWSIHQHPTDTVSFIAHMEKLDALIGEKPKAVVGDSGFGSEENYEYLRQKEIDNYLKYNTFHQDLRGGGRGHAFDKAAFTYDKTSNSYRCPAGRRLSFKESRENKTDNGYVVRKDIYQCRDGQGCPFVADCTKGQGPRTIQRRAVLEQHRREALKNLTSPKGVYLRKQRNVDIETAFGQIKHNQGFRRFKMRGLKKVNIEMGLLCMAHNLKRMFNISHNIQQT